MRRDIFQAISDPTRRAIIALIAFQSMTPNAIAEHFNTSRQAISKHIRYLSECDLLDKDQQGREIYYQLKFDKIDELNIWTSQIKQIWEGRFNQLDELLEKLKSK